MGISLLAADLGNYIGLAFLVITIVGWIANAIKGNDANGNPLPKKRAKPNRDLRSEIEVFLEELQQPKAAQPRPEPPRQPPPQQRPAPVAKKKNRQEKSARGSKPGSAFEKPLARVQRRSDVVGKPELAPAGSMQQHVDAYMGQNRIDREVRQHFAGGVARSVQQHLSGGTVAAVEPAPGMINTPHPLLAMFKTNEGFRQAILMNEILQRPRALRRKN